MQPFGFHFCNAMQSPPAMQSLPLSRIFLSWVTVSLFAFSLLIWPNRNKNPKNSDCETRWQNHPTRNRLLEEEISATTEEDFATRCPVDRRTIIYCHWGFYSDQMADGYVVRFPNFFLYSRRTRLGEMVQQCVPWITDVGDSIQRAKMACLTSQDISWIQKHFTPNTRREWCCMRLPALAHTGLWLPFMFPLGSTKLHHHQPD